MIKYTKITAVKELADLTYTMWQMGWDEKKWWKY